MDKFSVIVADSEYLVRVGLKHILQSQPSFKVLSEAANEGQLFEVLQGSAPDILVLDYNQPGFFSTSTIDRVRSEFPKVKLLVVSSDEDKKHIYQVLESGVNSYMSKQCDEKEIIDAFHATSKNEKYYCTNVLNHLLEKSFPTECTPTPLTPREIEIVRLVASGLIAKEIASELNLSTHTVYTHRKNIMKKLKIGSTSELVLYAVNERII